jgi:glycerol-3-phosphate cytidylyltransferase
LVGLSTDEFNAIKGKKAYHTWEQRATMLKGTRYVDYVFPENEWKQKKEDVEKYRISVFTMGDDWKGKFDFLEDDCEVIYLPRTKGISSTQIRGILNAKSN